jgi:hypothetical protein
MTFRQTLIATVLLSLVGTAAHADPAAVKQTQDALRTGRLADGATALGAMIANDGANDEARFGLGMVRFVQAIEHLSQGFYRYGLQPPRSVMMPIVRLPVPDNADPEPIDYDKFRALLLTFAADLDSAEKTMAGMATADVKIPVDLVDIHYDADGNGTVTPDETLTAALARFLDVDAREIGTRPMTVAFDRADAYWLRGYCHVLMALSEFLLAYDWRESFDDSFHIFFPRAHSPFQEALAPPGHGFISSETAIADLISFLHIRWQVVEPQRLVAVRDHLKQVIALSRQDFAAIVAETDNDREWIPNPNQAGASGSPVTANQIAAWHAVLDTFDGLLDGKLLMPHWRLKQGVNLRRVFTEPRPFDLVLWITGPAALPYVEDGRILTSEEWGDLTSAFEGSFGSYAVWFN